MPELRKDPIVGRWVIISKERGKRPKDFIVTKEISKGGVCPFCVGNENMTPKEVLSYRTAGTQPNTPGWTLRVVPNKFPALVIEGGLNREGDGIYDRMNGIGAHEVIIESTNHEDTLITISQKQFEDILWSFRDRMVDLSRDSRFKYILIFKNYGSEAGASLEHSHSQLIALPAVPKVVSEEMAGAKEFYSFKERCIFCDIVRQEISQQTRIIYENDYFIAISPYAPRFPFETWIIPKNHTSCFTEGQKPEYEHLSRVFKTVLKKLSLALDDPPFNFMLHTSPLNIRHNDFYHWHFEIIPKLTHVAGFEWGSGFYINPTPPEEAAQFLREIEV